MLIPYVKAKEKNSGEEIRGFYFEYPRTTYYFSESYERNPVEIVPCVITHVMTGWDLPNRPVLYEIDRSTLQFVGFVNTINKTYNPSKYIKMDYQPEEVVPHSSTDTVQSNGNVAQER